jgi:porin
MRLFLPNPYALAAAAVVFVSLPALGQGTTNASATATNVLGKPDSLWRRPALGGDWFGAQPALEEQGLSLKVELTQFGSGMLCGDGSRSWQYGGRGDLYATLNGAQAGLWDGLFIGIRGEQNFGQDLDGSGGTLIPNNASLAFPGPHEGDLGVEITQKFFDVVAIKFGKLNMVDAAKATPLKGGGGIDTFMNTALAVPPTGLIPPEIFGAFLNVSTRPVSWAFGVYDPVSAAQRSGLDNPFSQGVSFRASATLTARPLGLQGFYGLKAMYSTMHGVDLDSIPDLLLPPESSAVLKTLDNPYYVGASVQQYVYQDEKHPSKGWGFFAEFGGSDANPTPQQWAGLFGLGGTSPLPGRGADRLGVAVFRNSLSDSLVRGLSPLLQLRDEEGLEAFYNIGLTPWLHLTPDLQLIRPYQADAQNVVFFSLRTNIKF